MFTMWYLGWAAHYIFNPWKQFHLMSDFCFWPFTCRISCLGGLWPCTLSMSIQVFSVGTLLFCTGWWAFACLAQYPSRAVLVPSVTDLHNWRTGASGPLLHRWLAAQVFTCSKFVPLVRPGILHLLLQQPLRTLLTNCLLGTFLACCTLCPQLVFLPCFGLGIGPPPVLSGRGGGGVRGGRTGYSSWEDVSLSLYA